jgi:hypothetical protein
MAQLDRARTDPLEELLIAPGALMVRTGLTTRIRPLPLDAQPELRTVVERLRESLYTTNR